MPTLKVLIINSYAVHGTASLKAATAILGSRALPVPSVMLNGLTNMPYVQKQPTPFKELLEGTFRLIVHRNQKVILCIGYLGNPDQVDLILEMIAQYRDYIQTIITDPISGDHGHSYVPEDIIRRWPELVRISDFTFPNLTELRLLTGYPPNDSQSPDVYLESFEKLFPATRLVVTSIAPDTTSIGILYRHRHQSFRYNHQELPQHFGGTGDAFVSYFILFYFFDRSGVENALRDAAEKIHERILYSIRAASDELLV